MSSASRKLRLLRSKRRVRFLRHQWWKFWKFVNDLKWRRPKGIDNPMRLRLKGMPPRPSSGFGTPREVRGLHPSGLRPVVVRNVKELESLNPSEVIVYVGRTVGRRKRVEIVSRARELGFLVANEGVE
ncbi:MAG: 50S ribosomal protein L32e [Zestosphaera sp.]